MASHIFAIGALAAVTALAAASDVPTFRHSHARPSAAPGRAGLYVVGTRSPNQSHSATASKLDSVLADLSRHAMLARPDHLLTDLRSISPAARFIQSTPSGTPFILVDAITRGDPQQLKSALVDLGLQHAAVYSNDVGGWLPVGQIGAAVARDEVVAMRAAMPHTRGTGPVALQGDYVQRSDVVRTTYPTLTGTGITVGVLSDSFNCYAVYAAPGSGVPVSGNQGYAYNGFTADYASDISTEALPSGVNVIEEGPCLNYLAPDSQNQPTGLPLSDEGRAMLQIVHVVAPGASLAFYSGDNSEADFAAGIVALQKAGAKVIADDLGYFDEPFFEDGVVAQAIDAVEARGVAYFSAAGNDQGTPAYQNTAPSFGTLATSGSNQGEYLLNFDTTNATTTTALPVTIPSLPPGEFVAVVVEWDQPYVTGCTAVPSTLCTGASSQIDVCITGGTGSDTILNYDNTVISCSGPNAVGTDPYQVMIIANPANASGSTQAQNLNIVVGLVNGTKAPGRIIVAVEDDGLGSTITQFATNSPTLQGHPGAAGAGAVGAAFYFNTPRCGASPTLEQYSSAGGLPILFTTAGVRLGAPQYRSKPDFIGPDGVNNTFLGATLASGGIANGLLNTTDSNCQNNPSYPNFFGTSAATPHVAGIAALMLQANSAVTPTQIYTALRTSALPMGSPVPNYDSGYGFIQADAALALIAPGTPALTLSASSILAGGSTTITWSSVDTTGCTASGSWSGALAASGTRTLTPTAAGTDAYSLTCANAAGSSAASSVSLTVTAPPSKSGGGDLDLLSLLGLAGIGAARLFRLRPCVLT